MLFDFSQIDLVQHPECEHLPLVVYIAKRMLRKFGNRGVGLEDLISVGWFTLRQCYESYKPERGPFVRYAGGALRRAFRAFLLKQRTLAVSRTTVDKVQRARRGEQPMTESVQRVADFLEMERVPLWQTPEKPTEDDTQAWSDRDDVAASVAKLGEKEREVITKHYGLDGEPQTLDAIGKNMQSPVTRARASYIHNAALEKLRKMFDCPA